MILSPKFMNEIDHNFFNNKRIQVLEKLIKVFDCKEIEKEKRDKMHYMMRFAEYSTYMDKYFFDEENWNQENTIDKVSEEQQEFLRCTKGWMRAETGWTDGEYNFEQMINELADYFVSISTAVVKSNMDLDSYIKTEEFNNAKISIETITLPHINNHEDHSLSYYIYESAYKKLKEISISLMIYRKLTEEYKPDEFIYDTFEYDPWFTDQECNSSMIKALIESQYKVRLQIELKDINNKVKIIKELRRMYIAVTTYKEILEADGTVIQTAIKR